MHHVTGAVELGSLVDRRQPAAGPDHLSGRVVPLGTPQHDVAGQVIPFGTQSVADPRPHRRSPGKGLPCLEHVDRKRVVVVPGVHRADQADVVGDRGGMWNQLAQPHPALPCLVKRIRRFQQDVVVVQLEGLDLLAGDLAVLAGQFRLLVEEVHLGRTPVLEQLDHRTGPGLGVSRSRNQVLGFIPGSQQPVPLQHPGQGQGAETGSRFSQHPPPCSRDGWQGR